MKYKIAVSGKKRSGKDTAAKCIGRYLLKNDFNHFAFANPIKECVLKMFPNLDPNLLYGPSYLREQTIPGAKDNQGNPLTIRQVLLDLGKQGRTYRKDIWINATIIPAEKSNKSVIISDLRFKNEMEALKRNNYILLRVKRPNLEESKDISETDLDDVPDSFFNKVIINDSSLNKFNQDVRDFCDNIVIS